MTDINARLARIEEALARLEKALGANSQFRPGPLVKFDGWACACLPGTTCGNPACPRLGRTIT